MDTTQFARLQAAVQWSLDEHLHRQGILHRHGLLSNSRGERRWNQATWADGRVTDEKIMVPSESYTSAEDATYTVVEVSCGSSCCIAGNIVASAGDKFVFDEEVEGEYEVADVIAVEYCVPKDGGRVVAIGERGAELLGLKHVYNEDGEDLFDGDNDIYKVINIATSLAAQDGHTLRLERLDLLPDNDMLIKI